MCEETTILVDLCDGRCRSCGGQLRVFHADDCSLEVECLDEECADAYRIEPDALNDGGITYWPQAMALFADKNGE